MPRYTHAPFAVLEPRRRPGSRSGGARSAPRSDLHTLILAVVWLTIASGAIVFTEPAPFDALMMGLVIFDRYKHPRQTAMDETLAHAQRNVALGQRLARQPF